MVAFGSGIASAVPEMLGKPYIDANGYEYGNMLGQPMLVFEGIYLVYKSTSQRNRARFNDNSYVHAMFSTGNDEDNRAVFLAEDANQLNLVGLALRGPKKQLIRQLKDFLCINKIFIGRMIKPTFEQKWVLFKNNN